MQYGVTISFSMCTFLHTHSTSTTHQDCKKTTQEDPKPLFSSHKCKLTVSSREQPKRGCAHYTLSGIGNSHLKGFWGESLK